MIEIVIFGRGGQGGVTLAKLVAGLHFLQGRHVQAFGSYGAERTGAPVKAFIRIDDREITARHQIYEPDHIVVLDPALVTPALRTGLKAGGWILLNCAAPPQAFAERFDGYRVATVDATRLALANSLGTHTTPIVNTTMLGAIARAFELGIGDVRAVLRDSGLGGPNEDAAEAAYESVRIADAPTRPAEVEPPVRPCASGISILERAGAPPVTKTGTWAKQHPDRQQLTSPCNHACPAGNDVRGFLAAVRKGELWSALGILLETTPFPSVCGRVCPAPCTVACHRAQLEGPVNVREVERYVGDHVQAPAPPAPSAGAARGSIAVVGSGPAGLSACYQLARQGYKVTLCERDAELGGLMRTGIPAYRLPPGVLDREINNVLGWGVEVKTQMPVGRTELRELAREHDAVFVATGLQHMRELGIGEGISSRVVQGLAFLDRARQGLVQLEGEDVVVFGGGNTAVDAARSALRLGAGSVRIVYRRTQLEMPAIYEEVREALEEGVVFDELVAPVALQGTDDHLVVSCNRTRLGDPDESGRRRPVPDTRPGSKFELRCTRAILALGASGDRSILPEGAVIRGEEVLDDAEADEPCRTLLVGGDFALDNGTVAAAIGSGRRAARRIHAMLTNSPDVGIDAPKGEAIGADKIRLGHFDAMAQQRPTELSVTERERNFDEVRGGLLPEQAACEAARCFSCGSCTHCDICRAHCPEGVLFREASGYRFDYDYCKGCGICVLECPRGALIMRQVGGA